MGDFGGEAPAERAVPLLERKPATPPPALPTASFAPVTPEIRKVAQAAWNSATPVQREAMQNQPGWRGQLAREQAGRIEGINPEATTSVMAKFDPRVEARTQQLILQGEDPRFAETAAREATSEGVAPGKEIEYLQNTQGLADKIKPTQFAPGEEFGKGALGAVNVGLPSLWEQAKVSTDAAVATTIQDRLNLFDKIDSGEITSPIDPQLRGMEIAPGQGRAYLDAPPENRQGMRSRLQRELGKRKDFIDASIKTLQAYQQESLKYKGRTEDFTDVRTVTDFSNWLAKQGGAGLVQLAPIMIAAVATGGAGVFAMSAAMGVSEATSNRLQAIEKKLAQLPENQRAQEVINYLQSSRDVNLAVGIFSGALDVVLGPAARMAKLFAGKMAKDVTRMEALKAGLKEVPKQVGEEAVTGGAQEAAQIAGEVQLKEQEKFLTDANIKRLINSSAAEAAGALGVSGPTVASRVARTHGILSQEEAATTAADRAAEAAKTNALKNWATTFGGGAAPAPAPVAPTVAAAPAAPAPAPVAPPTPSASRVFTPEQTLQLAELTQKYMLNLGMEPEQANVMAQRALEKMIAAQTPAPAPTPAAPAPAPAPPAPLTAVQTRAAEIEDELINAGVAPDQAKVDALAKAQQEEADDAAAAKAEEEKNVVAESVEPPSEVAAPKPESTEVVSTEPDVEEPPTEEQQPPPVTTRTLADVTAEIDAGMEEVKQLTQQQQALLTKAGRKPAVKSPAFAKWDALGAQIDAKKDAVGRLFIEEDKLKKEGQATTSTTAPGAPILIDSVSSAGDLETEASKYVGRGVPITLKDGTKAELIIFEEAPPFGVSSAIVAIDSKGNPLGTLQFEFDPEGKSQPDVGVRPEALRKGVATAMYDYAEQLGAKFPAENTVRTEDGVAFHTARKKAKLAKETSSGTEAVETKQTEPQAQETATPEFFDSLGIPPQALVRTKHAGAELTSPDLRAALVRLTQNKSIKDVPKTLAAIGKFLSSTKNSVTKPLESIAPATIQTDTPAFKKWFSDSKLVGANGEPLVVYRGGAGGNLTESFLNAEAREGYATFASNNPAIANTYANPDLEFDEAGAVTPLYVKATRLIEFPVTTDKNGRRSFDKFAFDRRALTLAPGEVLVVRQVLDTGPRAKLAVDPGRLWSYPSDIYAWGPGTSVKSATGNKGTFNEASPRINEAITAPATTPRAPKVATPRIHVRQNLAALNERLRSGKITLEQHAQAVENLVARMEAAAGIRQGSRRAGRERGPDIVREKLLAARRRGELDADTVEFALWLLNKYPHVAEGLAISVKAGTEAGTLGHYVEASRLIALFKGYSNPITAVHEILHHTERMMPEAVQLGIRKLWAEKYSAALKAATNPKQVEALEAILLAMAGDEPSRKLVREAFDTGVLKIDPHYQLTNPSEYWAVNATNILANRYAANSWIAKAKQWLMELLEKVKGLLGLQSNAPVLKGLKDILAGNGEFLSKRVLAEISGAILPAIAPPPTPSAPPTPTPAATAVFTPTQIRTQVEIDKDVAISDTAWNEAEEASEAARIVWHINSLKSKGHTAQLFASSIDAMSNKGLSALLFPMPLNYAASFGSRVLGNQNLNNVAKLIGKMRGEQYRILKAAGEVSSSMTRAISADPSLRRKLAGVMYPATDARIDPSLDPAKGTGKDERSPQLYARYKALGPVGQRIYKEQLGFYEAMVDRYSDLLDQQILAANLPKGAHDLIMAEIKKLYEVDNQIRPYFPLVRNPGTFWLRIAGGPKIKPEFYILDSVAQRDAVIAEVAKRKGITPADLMDGKKADKGDDLTSQRIAASESVELLKATFTEIDKIKNTLLQNPADFAKVIEDLKDSIYDLYLTTLPEQSFRKSFITRKDRAGYSPDLVRNFSLSVSHMASQLSRIEYGGQLRNAVLAAQKSLEGNPKKSKYERFVQDMNRRVRLELHPYAEPSTGIAQNVIEGAANIASVATRVSFVYYLSAASSALVQLSSMFISASLLGARHGYGNATRELFSLLNVVDNFTYKKEHLADRFVEKVMPTMAGSARLARNPDEARALREMGTSGLDVTLVNEMAGRARIPSLAYEGGARKVGRGVMTLAGGLFHTMERITREVTFMASYRLSRKASQAAVNKGTLTNEEAHVQAVDQAIADTSDSIGNVAEHNRAPIFRGVGGKIAGQFLAFTIFQTLQTIKTMVKTLPFLNKEGKSQALKELAGIYGATWMLAGVAGWFGFSIVLGLIGAALNALRDEDKPEELKSLNFTEYVKDEWFPESWSTTVNGKPLGNLVLRGPINYFADLDVHSRTSMDSPWAGSHIEGKTPRAEILRYAEKIIGPTGTMLLNVVDGVEAFANGDWQKGGEKVLPAGLRAPFIAIKLGTEGAKGVHGEELMSRDSFTTGALLWQAIGMRSDRLANLQSVNFEMYTLGQKIGKERNNILHNIGDAFIKDQEGRQEKWEEEARKFNDRFPIPGVKITAEGLKKSKTNLAKLRDSSNKGIAFTPENILLFMDAADASRDAAEWLEDQTSAKKREITERQKKQAEAAAK
jgi:hypothetical protein